MARRALGLVLGLTLIGCSSDPQGGPMETPNGGVITPAGRFYAGLLFEDGTSTVAVDRTSCAVAVRGGSLPSEDLAPLEGLHIEASNRGGRLRATADADGRVALPNLSAGVHEVIVRSPDARLRGTLIVVGTARRIDLYGSIQPDTADVDGDLDVEESVLVVEVLPDDNQDRVSDNGRRALWSFTADGGVAWTHLGNDFSERSSLDAQHEPKDAILIADRDGDFIGDADDADIDGDGRINANDTDNLLCPGFSHDDLFDGRSEHKDFTCERCHQLVDPVPLSCQDCHSSIGREPTEVPEDAPAGHFQVRCEQCHQANRTWEEAPGPDGELHDAFALEGHHLRTDCFSCHESGNLNPPTICVDCHLEDRTPDHFQDSCEVCHSAADWKPPIARHDQFPLAGGHENVDCQRCHNPPDYTSNSTDCASCHMEDTPARHEPAGFLAEDCASCHEIEAWASHRYLHPQWALVGKHMDAACVDCHTADDTIPYDNVNSDCVACHETAPTFPDHSNTAVFGDCSSCHEPTGWVPATSNSIDHSVFPLVGSHETAPCSTCHENGTLLRPPTDCTSCHLGDRPSRHTGFFDGDCAGCHESTTWEELAMPHDHVTSFPLTGVHLTAVCSTCHNGPTYDAPTDCIGCHMMEKPPMHYGDNCADCHGTANWNPTGSLNHHTVDPTAFPLTLGHENLTCTDCHIAGQGFTALPENCEACHLNDQPAGHANDGCATCHDPGIWTQPTQPPTGVIHPLTGRHTNRTCVSCHGNYVPNVGFTTPDPSPTCANCHALPNNHFAVGQTDCGGCHTVGGWLPAAGGHTGPLPTSPFPYNTWTNNRWFPTNHRSANQCSDCHTDQNNYALFSCNASGCHGSANSLNGDHNNGRDKGNDADKQFHLYHYDSATQHTPANEGGGPWPSGNTGCVNRNCHPTGRN